VIARQCMEEDVILAPGNVFSISESAASFLRFNVAQMADERSLVVLRHAMDFSNPPSHTRPAGRDID
jgi:DNA-binding transcriptional MocR family regulator